MKSFKSTPQRTESCSCAATQDGVQFTVLQFPGRSLTVTVYGILILAPKVLTAALQQELFFLCMKESKSMQQIHWNLILKAWLALWAVWAIEETVPSVLAIAMALFSGCLSLHPCAKKTISLIHSVHNMSGWPWRHSSNFGINKWSQSWTKTWRL